MTDALDQPPPPASPEVQDPAEALRISEERLTLVARATTDTVWDWNVSTNARSPWRKTWLARLRRATTASPD